MKRPLEHKSLIFEPSYIHCPLKRCEHYGHSRLCYIGQDYVECSVYNDTSFVQDFVNEVSVGREK